MSLDRVLRSSPGDQGLNLASRSSGPESRGYPDVLTSPAFGVGIKVELAVHGRGDQSTARSISQGAH